MRRRPSILSLWAMTVAIALLFSSFISFWNLDDRQFQEDTTRKPMLVSLDTYRMTSRRAPFWNGTGHGMKSHYTSRLDTIQANSRSHNDKPLHSPRPDPTNQRPHNRHSYLNIDNETLIRSWGCSLTEMPFIFVHLGKMGGGSIRRQIAYSATNYTRSVEDWYKPELDDSYYMSSRFQNNNKSGSNRTNHKAYFCNSGHLHFMPIAKHESFEGTRVCLAMTPVGQALVCPELDAPNPCRRTNFTPDDYVVYVGHNGVGTELHWLSSDFLQSWWNQTWANPSFFGGPVDSDGWNGTTDGLFLAQQWKHRQQFGNEARYPEHQDKTLARVSSLDGATHRILQRFLETKNQEFIVQRPFQQDQHQSLDLNETTEKNATRSRSRGRLYAALYASLPVLRAIMIREPFSWLGSIFAWQELSNMGVDCHDIAYATDSTNHWTLYRAPVTATIQDLVVHNGSSVDWSIMTRDIQMIPMHHAGWMRRLALDQIYDWCGADCRVRHLFHPGTTLEELVAQAEWNLRHSFSVVGIFSTMEDDESRKSLDRSSLSSSGRGQETFLEMLAQRIDYLHQIVQPKVSASNGNTSDDGRHSTEGLDQDCKQIFLDASFQRAVLQASPEVSALVHLYQVAVQVNQFQQEELHKCRPLHMDARLKD